MGQHIIDTPLKVATCNRCGNIVFAADVAGLKVMADPAPMQSLAEAGIALVDGRSLYRVLRVAGKPHKLQLIIRDPGRVPLGDMVAEHGCGCSGRDAEPVEVTEKDPRRAPATRGRPWAGLSLPDALAGAQTSAQGFCSATSSPLAHAKRVSPRRSEVQFINRVCQRCRRLIGRDKNVIGIEYNGRWVWVQHDDC